MFDTEHMSDATLNYLVEALKPDSAQCLTAPAKSGTAPARKRVTGSAAPR